MQMNQIRNPDWRQVDAGLWVKPAPAGHVEISFASDAQGAPLYEVAAFDAYGRPCEVPFASCAFEAFETARDMGDVLTSCSIDMSTRVSGNA